MASGRPPTSGDGDGFPISHDFSQTDAAAAPSVISSRLSGDEASQRPKSGISKKSGGAASRPDTSKTGASSKSKAGKSTTQNKRTSGVGPSKRESANPPEPSTRSRNLASRSHVPSLTSNAFFRPMSSQKLQAHRSSTRPTTMSQQQQQEAQQELNLDDGATDIGGTVMRRSTSSNQGAGIQRNGAGEYHMQCPPSRGTEVTEQDRVTANTSPTAGHYPTGSLSDSVRPLHKNSDASANRPGLSVNVDKSYRDIGQNIPSPVKSPRSFRSSFLLSGRDSGQGQNRNTEGAEKLSSGASSPKFNQMDGQGLPKPQASQQPSNPSKLGRVYHYFEGNTRFCLGGRWQNTKGRPINLATGLFIIVPCVFFFGFSAPWLWHNVSPAIPITFAYLAFVCMSSFIHASVADPGVSDYSNYTFDHYN